MIWDQGILTLVWTLIFNDIRKYHKKGKELKNSLSVKRAELLKIFFQTITKSTKSLFKIWSYEVFKIIMVKAMAIKENIWKHIIKTMCKTYFLSVFDSLEMHFFSKIFFCQNIFLIWNKKKIK